MFHTDTEMLSILHWTSCYRLLSLIIKLLGKEECIWNKQAKLRLIGGKVQKQDSQTSASIETQIIHDF